jgi:hypothetical protein
MKSDKKRLNEIKTLHCQMNDINHKISELKKDRQQIQSELGALQSLLRVNRIFRGENKHKFKIFREKIIHVKYVVKKFKRDDFISADKNINDEHHYIHIEFINDQIPIDIVHRNHTSFICIYNILCGCPTHGITYLNAAIQSELIACLKTCNIKPNDKNLNQLLRFIENAISLCKNISYHFAFK